VMVVDRRLRSLTQSYVDRKVKLTEFDVHEMKLKLREQCLPLFHFIAWCENEYESRDYFPPSLVTFIKCIASISPVTSYFPIVDDNFRQVFQELKAGLQIRKHAAKLSQLQKVAPVICTLIADLPSGALPDPLLGVLDALEEKTTWLVEIQPHNLTSYGDSTDDKMTSFLPNWPLLNIRGTYKKDLEKRKERKNDCRKDYRGHPSLMPGIFTLYCPHDICYGFEVMEVQESPNTPFTIFRTRYKEAPKAIIYDNSCNLHHYSLNRDPGFFSSTSFFVDRFHWKNHTACAPSYNLSLYQEYDGLNSQINEQRNSTLKKVKNQLSYMSPSNFVNHCKLLLWYCNQKKILTLNTQV